MGLGFPFNEPFYEGSGVSDLVPGKYPVAIDGRPYLLDTKASGNGWEIVSIQQLRQQADQSAQPGEQSLNPEDGWRRFGESWHHGAGQSVFDRADSDRFRFRSSKGVDVWEKWRAKLLPDTTLARASIESNLDVILVGAYTYICEGAAVRHSTTLAAWTSADIQAGEAAQTVQSITSDGNLVYAALGTNGIHTTARGAATSSHYSALNCSLLRYVKGRLMAAQGAAIYNVTAGGAAPDPLFTHPNSDFAWTGFAEGPSHIYAAGYSGDKSLIYRTAVKADGTGLDVPVVAARLPDGEIIRSLSDYLGQTILIGTDTGWWVAEDRGNGDLLVNNIEEIGVPVRCFEGQRKFVWFGWSNFDGASTGLGRMDLTQNVAERNVITPAYASDLMAVAQGEVLGVATTSDGRRIFAVSGTGFYVESANLVASGWLRTGEITVGLPEEKTALFVLLSHLPLDGEVVAAMAADGGVFDSVGVSSVEGSTAVKIRTPEVRAETFELELRPERSAGTPTTGPEMTRWTLRVEPSGSAARFAELPLLLHEDYSAHGGEGSMEPLDEYESLVRLRESKRVVKVQQRSVSESMTLEDFRFVPYGETRDAKRPWWNGTFFARFKRLA